MSLSALNSPALVAAAGVGGLAALPTLERLALEGAISFTALKTANAIAYAIQLVAVSIPGRIDGQMAEEMKKEQTGKSEVAKTSDGKDEDGKIWTPRQGRTLVAPAGWAFAIWGPIFLGELVFVVVQSTATEASALGSVLRKMSVPFAMAQTFQTLWCAAFRPKYRGNLMFISTGLLSAVAYSLSKAHSAFAGSTEGNGLLFLPIAMHFGWTTAASLVNLNGAISMKETISAKAIALTGHTSAIAATVAGIAVTFARSAPTYGGVVAWALFACADGMKKRIASSKKEDDDAAGMYGAQTQWWLCRIGAFACTAAATFVGGKQLLRR